MNIPIDKSYDAALLGMLLHFIPDGGGKLNYFVQSQHV
jgi:hypothetical protein